MASEYTSHTDRENGCGINEGVNEGFLNFGQLQFLWDLMMVMFMSWIRVGRDGFVRKVDKQRRANAML